MRLSWLCFSPRVKPWMLLIEKASERVIITKNTQQPSIIISFANVQPRATAGRTDFAAKVEFCLRDMRHIEDQGIYDGAYCFGNSFAFLEHAELEKFLRAIARALKPGARFIIETGMAAESVLPDFEEQSSHDMGDLALTIKERYLAAESCIDSEYIFERDGQTESRLAREWIYTVAEIRRMLERAGLSVLDLYGSLKCKPYKLGSRELFIVSEAR